MMQGITEILKTIQPVQVQVVPTLPSIQEQPTLPPPVSNLTTPVQQPSTIPPTHSPNMLTSPTTNTPPCVTPANPYPMVPPVPPYSESTHQSNTPQQSINLQPPPQTIVNQSTIPFFFNQQPQQPALSPAGNSTNTNGQQTVYIQQSNTQVKLDEFKPSRGDNYSYWKTQSLSLLHSNTNQFYSTMVIFDDTSTLFTLNDNMTPRQNSKLYFMTTKALGHTLAQKFISQANQNSSNGRELWETLDARYLNKEQSSYLLQDGLRIAYDKLRMNDNETMFDFSHRYDVAYGKLVQNNMDTLTGAWLTLHFIKALNKPSVFTSLKTKLHLPAYDKYITTNIKQLGRELETYHDIHVQAYGTGTPAAPQPAVPPPATPRAPTITTPTPAAQPPAAPPQPNAAPQPPTPAT